MMDRLFGLLTDSSILPPIEEIKKGIIKFGDLRRMNRIDCAF